MKNIIKSLVAVVLLGGATAQAQDYKPATITFPTAMVCHENISAIPYATYPADSRFARITKYNGQLKSFVKTNIACALPYETGRYIENVSLIVTTSRTTFSNNPVYVEMTNSFQYEEFAQRFAEINQPNSSTREYYSEDIGVLRDSSYIFLRFQVNQPQSGTQGFTKLNRISIKYAD